MTFPQKLCKQDENGVKYFKCLEKDKKKNWPRILYPGEISLKREGRKMIFSDKQKKLREFVSSRPALQEMLKEILQREGKLYRSQSLIYKERKNTWKCICEGKIKTFSFLNWSNR